MNLVVFPEELISEIFLFTGFVTCVNNNRQFETKKLYNTVENNWIWAAKDGNLMVLKWLFYNRSKKYIYSAMACAADKGHIEIVKWLYYNQIGEIEAYNTSFFLE